MAPPPPSPALQNEPVRLLLSPGSPLLRTALVLAGALYIAGVFCEGSGTSLHRVVYRPVLFFCQIAALFPRAATHSIEYRAEGHTCTGNGTVEIDLAPLFPIHAEDKENRFDRAMFFYHQHKPTMTALDAYIVREYNRTHSPRIGGVTLLSLRIPLPPVGSDFPRYARLPLADYPKEQRKVWYETPRSETSNRCLEVTP